MTKHDDDGWWEWNGDDEEGEYELVGSLPLSVFEVMVLRSEQVSGVIDLEMEHLR